MRDVAIGQWHWNRWQQRGNVNLPLPLAWLSLLYSIAPKGRLACIISTTPTDQSFSLCLTHINTQTHTYAFTKISLVYDQSTFSFKTPHWVCSLRALLWAPNARAIRLGRRCKPWITHVMTWLANNLIGVTSLLPLVLQITSSLSLLLFPSFSLLTWGNNKKSGCHLLRQRVTVSMGITKLTYQGKRSCLTVNQMQRFKPWNKNIQFSCDGMPLNNFCVTI